MAASTFSENNKGKFVCNDVEINKEQKCILLSGPNMGGKSTIMRQLALTVVLAQMGLPVPASSASLPLFDQMFSRIGSTDDLIRSKSTFFLECEETLEPIKNATDKSLCLIDEFGRGTSTLDGTAIAYSSLQYLIATNQTWMIFSSH
mmetsp:Transcript_67690/g.145938  ORF Transcript_67690/g.145938 Transcript_67690/m.145938 type:complete len:147 (-) Transcript_67690:331-771(-)